MATLIDVIRKREREGTLDPSVASVLQEEFQRRQEEGKALRRKAPTKEPALEAFGVERLPTPKEVVEAVPGVKAVKLLAEEAGAVGFKELAQRVIRGEPVLPPVEAEGFRDIVLENLPRGLVNLPSAVVGFMRQATEDIIVEPAKEILRGEMETFELGNLRFRFPKGYISSAKGLTETVIAFGESIGSSVGIEGIESYLEKKKSVIHGPDADITDEWVAAMKRNWSTDPVGMAAMFSILLKGFAPKIKGVAKKLKAEKIAKDPRILARDPQAFETMKSFLDEEAAQALRPAMNEMAETFLEQAKKKAEKAAKEVEKAETPEAITARLKASLEEIEKGKGKLVDEVPQEVVDRIVERLRTGEEPITKIIDELEVESVKEITERVKGKGIADVLRKLREEAEKREVTKKEAIKEIEKVKTPEEVAEELGIRYEGFQEGVGDIPGGHMFTDLETKSSFLVRDLGKAKEDLARIRKPFEEAKRVKEVELAKEVKPEAKRVEKKEAEPPRVEKVPEEIEGLTAEKHREIVDRLRKGEKQRDVIAAMEGVTAAHTRAVAKQIREKKVLEAVEPKVEVKPEKGVELKLEKGKSVIATEAEILDTLRGLQVEESVAKISERLKLSEDVVEGIKKADDLETIPEAIMDKFVEKAVERAPVLDALAKDIVKQKAMKAAKVRKLEKELSKAEADLVRQAAEEIESKTAIKDVEYKQTKKRLIDTIKKSIDELRKETGAIEPLKDLDARIFEDIVKLAHHHIERGAKSFKNFSDAMVETFGEKVRPHLSNAWDNAKGRDEEFKTTIKGMEKFGDPFKIVKQRVIKGKKMTPISEAEANMVLRTHKESGKARGRTREALSRFQRQVFENPIRFFEQLDRINGTLWKEVLYRPWRQAVKDAKVEFLEIKKFTSRVRKELPRGASERIGAFAVSLQKGGVEILKEHKIKVPKLSAAEMAVYNRMRGHFDQFFERINAARELAGLDPINKTDNYFTFMRLIESLGDEGMDFITSKHHASINEIMTAAQSMHVHPKGTPFRYAIERVRSLEAVDLDAFRVFEKYSFIALNHIHISPVVAKGRQLLSQLPKGDRKLMLKDLSPESAKIITDWLDTISGKPGQLLRGPDVIERRAQTLNRNLAFAVLSGSVRSALIQPFAITQTVGAIGQGWTRRGIWGNLTKKWRRIADEKSDLITREYDVAAKEALAAKVRRAPEFLPQFAKKGVVKYEVLRERAGELGLKPLQLFDIETARSTWIGAYRKATELFKMGDIEAINFANDVVTKTQGSALRGDLSPIQRTVLGRMITLFQTFNINQWGFLTRDVLKTGRGGGIEAPTEIGAVKAAAAYITATALLSTFYEEILGLTSPSPTPIRSFAVSLDEGDSLVESSAEAAKEIAELIPVVGGAVRYGSSLLGAGPELLNDIIQQLPGAPPGPKKEFVEVLGKILGIAGTAQARKMARAIENEQNLYDILVGIHPNHRRILLEILTE